MKNKLGLVGMSLLLNSDGADGGDIPSFLTENLAIVDTSIPLIVENAYELTVAELKTEPNKAGNGTNLKFILKTTGDAQTTRGDAVGKGFPIFHTISITPTEKYSEDAIKRAVAGFVQAMGGNKLFPLEQYVGKTVAAKVILKKEQEKDGQTYPPSNAIKMFLKK